MKFFSRRLREVFLTACMDSTALRLTIPANITTTLSPKNDCDNGIPESITLCATPWRCAHCKWKNTTNVHV